MTWSRFDDAAPKSPKARAAGNDAWALWAAAVMYCNRHLTDGIVSLAALATDCLPEPITPARAKKLAALLVEAKARPDGPGLFEDAGGGFYLVHDFLDWNPSKVEVEQKRKADRDRKRGGGGTESGGGPRGIPNGNPSGNPGGVQSDSERSRVSARAPARALPPCPPLPPDLTIEPTTLSLTGKSAPPRLAVVVVRCPRDLQLEREQRVSLLRDGVDARLIDRITMKFRAEHANNDETRPLATWRSWLLTVITGHRDKPATPPGAVEHEARKAEQRSQAPLARAFAPRDNPAPLPLGETLAALKLAQEAIGS